MANFIIKKCPTVIITGKLAGTAHLYVQDQSQDKQYKTPSRGKPPQNTNNSVHFAIIAPIMLLSTPLNAVIAKVQSVNTDATAVHNLAALYLEANLLFSEKF